MKQLASNQQLYDYLGEMESVLQNRGAVELATIVAHARKFAAGSSTEFLGESRIALRRLQDARPEVLTADERSELRLALRDLDGAFNRR